MAAAAILDNFERPYLCNGSRSTYIAVIFAIAQLSCFNDTLLCLVIVIFNTSSSIKYVLSPIIDVTATFGSIHLASELQMCGTAYIVTAPSVNSF